VSKRRWGSGASTRALSDCGTSPTRSSLPYSSLASYEAALGQRCLDPGVIGLRDLPDEEQPPVFVARKLTSQRTARFVELVLCRDTS
jgi:hypothetical protein